LSLGSGRPLDRAPDAEWSRYLNAHCEGRQDFPGEFPIPRVVSSAIQFGPRDDDLERWVALVEEAIEKANHYYQTRVLPDQQAAEERRRVEDEDRRRRIERAQRQADELKS
jgi:hypothetical protein